MDTDELIIESIIDLVNKKFPKLVDNNRYCNRVTFYVDGRHVCLVCVRCDALIVCGGWYDDLSVPLADPNMVDIITTRLYRNIDRFIVNRNRRKI